MQDIRIVRLVLATLCLLLIVFLAMYISGEVTWDLFDFAVMGVLVLGTGLSYELVTKEARKRRNTAYLAAAGITLITAFLLIWVNLAVGIIGNENNPANLLYIGVLAVGLISTLIARLKPHGMARALYATAIAHAVVLIIAFLAGWHHALLLDIFFVLLWTSSALLFQRAVHFPEQTGEKNV